MDVVPVVPVESSIDLGHGGEEHLVIEEHAAAQTCAYHGSPGDGGGLIVEAHDGLPDGTEVHVDKHIGTHQRLSGTLFGVVEIAYSRTTTEEPVLADIQSCHDIQVGGIVELIEVITVRAGFAHITHEGGIAALDLQHKLVLLSELCVLCRGGTGNAHQGSKNKHFYLSHNCINFDCKDMKLFSIRTK